MLERNSLLNYAWRWNKTTYGNVTTDKTCLPEMY